MSETLTPPEVSFNSFLDLVRENQKIWRDIPRGIVSRPVEMPALSRFIDGVAKRVFRGFIDQEWPPVIITAAGMPVQIADKPPNYYDYQKPKEIAEGDEQDYKNGIYVLNEWATNYTTRYFFNHISTTPIIRRIPALYGELSDVVFGKPGAMAAYKAMAEVQKTAESSNQDFAHAVFTAMFSHQFDELNMLIAQTKTLGAQSLDELAISVGHSLPKRTDINALIANSFTEKPTDHALVRTLKRMALPLLSAGSHSRPGIIELWATSPVVYTAMMGLQSGSLIASPEVMAAGTLALASSYLGFFAAHEAFHTYSTSKDYSGLIPITMKRWNSTKAIEESSQ